MMEQPQTDDERRAEAVIERLALRIAKYRLQAPAVLFLEMHRPIAWLGAQAIHFFAPLVVPFVGAEAPNDLALVLSDGERVRRLIDRIESTMGAPRSAGEEDGAL